MIAVSARLKALKTSGSLLGNVRRFQYNKIKEKSSNYGENRLNYAGITATTIQYYYNIITQL